MSRTSRFLPLLIWLVWLSPFSTDAQTAHLVTDLEPFGDRNPGSEPNFLTRIEQRAIFEAFRPGVGHQLWSTDGTAGGTEVLPMWLSPRVLGALQGLAVVVDEFPDLAPDQTPPRGLYLSDGTAAGTRSLLPVGFRIRAVADRVAGDGVYFFGSAAGEGLALWRSDGSPGGARKVTALPSGEIRSATMAGNRLFFLASDRLFPNNCQSGDPPPECSVPVRWRLWTSLGTTSSTLGLPLSARALPYSEPLSLHGALGGGAFVSRRQETPAQRTLHFSRGTAETTVELAVYRVDEELIERPVLSPRFFSLGTTIYFYATSRDAGTELWTSDGTPRGTRRATNFSFERPFGTQSPPPAVATETGRLILLADDGVSGRQVWSTDGRPGSERRLTTLPGQPSQGFTDVYNPVAFDGRVFFTARDADGGLDLWVTDGTLPGTRIFFESGPQGFVSVNPIAEDNSLFFAGTRPGQSPQMFRLQVEGAVASEITQEPSFGTNSFLVLNGVRLGFFFLFAADDGQHGLEPWIAGFSGNARLLTDLEPGEGPSSNPTGLTRLGEQALFFACQDDEMRLFVTTGRSGETQLLQPLGRPCRQVEAEWQHLPPPIVVIGEIAFHAAGIDGQLWRTDGTAAGTLALTNFTPTSPETPQILGPVRVGAEVVLAQLDDVNATTGELTWRFSASDGTMAGTRLLFSRTNRRSPHCLFGGEDRFYLEEGALFRGDLGFWASDGTEAGTVRIAAASHSLGAPARPPVPRNGSSTSLDGQVTRLGERDYFRFNGELWATDGTPEGTASLAALFDEPGEVSGLQAWRGALYLFRRAFEDGAFHLWRTDGSDQGTVPLLEVGPALMNLPCPPFAELGDRLVWQATLTSGSLTLDSALFATDGSPEGSGRLDLGLEGTEWFLSPPTAFGGLLYLTVASAPAGLDGELWVSDGTATGTHQAQDITPGLQGSSPSKLLALSEQLLFVANDGLHGAELWSLARTATTCAPGASVLCLNGGRIRAEVVYQDRAGRQHTATAEPLTTDAGGFSFFRAGNLDLFVKVLDGSSVNGNGWVFVGSLSDAGFVLTLTDTQTGATRRYTNLQGRFTSFGDTQAFNFRGELHQGDVPLPEAQHLAPTTGLTAKAGACQPNAQRACLLDNRFAVEIDWASATASGEATMRPESSTSATFWFFRPDNLEGAVKMIDGRAVNGRFWFFFAGLTNLELTITVTDTQTGVMKIYRKLRGTFAAFGDTASL